MVEQARELLERIYNNPRLGASLALGNGCERIAYKLNDDLVVKISKEAMFNGDLLSTFKEDPDVHKYSRALWDSYDEGQSDLELHIYEGLSKEESKYFNPILDYGEFKNHLFTISPYVKIGRDMKAYSLDSLIDKTKSNIDLSILWEVCDRHDLEYEDLVSNSGNFGINSNGDIVIIDFGLRKLSV